MIFNDDEKRLLKDVKSGKSYFSYIPDDIGEILFCTTTTQSAKPMSKETRMVILVLSILVPGLLIYLFYDVILVDIVCLFAACVGIDIALFYKGTDYFVGTEGFAIAEFKKSRSNVVSKKVVRWDEVEDVIATEWVKVEKREEKLVYFIRVNGHPRGDEQQRPMLAHFKDDYQDGKLRSIYNYEVRFWKAVEEQWMEYIWPKVQVKYDGGEEVAFHEYFGGECRENYVRLQGKNLIVGKMAFREGDMQKVEADDEKITIYGSDYDTHLFGLVKEGTTCEIYLRTIGNCQILKHILNEHF